MKIIDMSFESNAVKTLSVFNSSTLVLSTEIDKKISFNTNEIKETIFAFQRVSVLVQRLLKKLKLFTCLLNVSMPLHCTTFSRSLTARTKYRAHVISTCNV